MTKNKVVIALLVILVLLLVALMVMYDKRYSAGYVEAKIEYEGYMDALRAGAAESSELKNQCIKECRKDGLFVTSYRYKCVNECLRYY